MKKVLSLIFALVLCASLCACGGDFDVTVTKDGSTITMKASELQAYASKANSTFFDEYVLGDLPVSFTAEIIDDSYPSKSLYNGKYANGWITYKFANGIEVITPVKYLQEGQLVSVKGEFISVVNGDKKTLVMEGSVWPAN